MPKLEAFNVFLSLAGTQITTDLISVEPEFTANDQDYTAGVNQAWKQSAAGLKESKWGISITYDTANVAAEMALFVTGTVVALIYGPEGNTTGKPKHTQNVLITGVKHARNVDKSMTTFDITAVGADTPSVDMNAGGVW